MGSFVYKEVIMRKLRFFSVLLLLLFVFAGCDAAFESSGCPEWDALIDLQEENIDRVIFDDFFADEEYTYVEPEVILSEDLEKYLEGIEKQLSREQIDAWVSLLKSCDLQFEKCHDAYEAYDDYHVGSCDGLSFQVYDEDAKTYKLIVTVYEDGLVVVEHNRNIYEAIYRSTNMITADVYEKLCEFCQIQEDNT